MIETQQTVLAILKACITGEQLCLPIPADQVDWSLVYQEFHDQAVTLLPSGMLSTLPLDEDTRNKWEKENVWLLYNMMRMIAVQSRVTEMLEKQGIPCAVLKGTAAAACYPEPHFRVLGDVDLLFREADVEAAAELLQKEGARLEEPGLYVRHMGATLDKVHFELHRYFSNKKTPADSQLDWELASALDRRQSFSIDNFSFLMLPEPQNGLVLLEHIHHHLPGTLGLRQLIDFLFYADQVLTDTYWRETFCPMAKKFGLDTLARTVVMIGKMHFGTGKGLHWCEDADPELCSFLLETLFSQGNMGRKNDRITRAAATQFSRSRHLGDLLRYEQRSGLSHWKAAQKHKLLYPAATVYGIFRHGVLLIKDRGDAKKLKKISSQSARHRELMLRLGLETKERESRNDETPVS